MLDLFGLYTLSLLFGGMVFFSFVFAPLVFTKLPADIAGGFIREVFPWYFLATAALFAVAAGVLAATAPTVAAAMAGLALLGALNRQVLMPRINAFRDAQIAGDAAAARPFARLHTASVAINLVQMAGAAAAIALLV